MFRKIILIGLLGFGFASGLNAMNNLPVSCNLCHVTRPANQLIESNEYFFCKKEHCSYFCEKCFLYNLDLQAAAYHMHLEDCYGKLRCPTCQCLSYPRKAQKFFYLLNNNRKNLNNAYKLFIKSFTKKFEKSDKENINPSTTSAATVENDMLTRALVTPHEGRPETCRCCYILRELLRSNKHDLLWEYFIHTPDSINLLRYHNCMLLVQIVRFYSDEKITELVNLVKEQ